MSFPLLLFAMLIDLGSRMYGIYQFCNSARIVVLILTCSVGWSIGIGPDAARGQESQELRRFEQTQPHLGVRATIVAYCTDRAEAERALTAAFNAIARIDRQFSDYRPDSDINQLVRDTAPCQPVRLSDELWPLFELAHQIAEESDGAFDYTLGPLTKLWRDARRLNALPTDQDRRAAHAQSGFRHIQLHFQRRTICWRIAGIDFDFGGIGKGYAADAALAALRQQGVHRALVDLGGDLAIGDPPPEREGWRIAVNNKAIGELPASFLELANCGIATSGDQQQFFEVDGVRYSHLIDPRTGMPVTGHRFATVIAGDAATADAFATVLNVMEVEAIERGFPRWSESRPKLQAILLSGESAEEMTYQFRSRNFPELLPVEDESPAQPAGP